MKGIDNHIIQLFKKYFGGNANRLEIRKLEQAAEADEYLQDAKDGADKMSLVVKETAIADLQARLAKRTGKKQNRTTPMQWLKLAAGVAILLSLGFYIWTPAKADKMADSIAVDKQATPQIETKKAKRKVQTIDLVPAPLEADANPFDIAGVQGTDAEKIYPGDNVEITEDIFNQGAVSESEVERIDYVPKELLAEKEAPAITEKAREDASEYYIDGVAVRGNLIPSSEPEAISEAIETNRPEAAAKSRVSDIAKSDETVVGNKPEKTEEVRNLPTRSISDLAATAAGVPDNTSFKTYTEKNLVKPDAAKNNNISGKVTLLFDINPAGRPTNIEVKKSLGYGCDEEAIRLLQEGPNWEQENKDGKTKVVVKFK